MTTFKNRQKKNHRHKTGGFQKGEMKNEENIQKDNQHRYYSTPKHDKT